jgi:hypothetical protein
LIGVKNDTVGEASVGFTHNPVAVTDVIVPVVVPDVIVPVDVVNVPIL